MESKMGYGPHGTYGHKKNICPSQSQLPCKKRNVPYKNSPWAVRITARNQVQKMFLHLLSLRVQLLAGSS
jgi:hypothetical protein